MMRSRYSLTPAGLLLGLLLLAEAPALGSGVYRDGIGARAMSLGGASVAAPDEPLEALSANPAGLSLNRAPRLQLGAWGAVAEGEFANAANPRSRLQGALGVAPEAAVVLPLKSTPVTLGLGVIPEAAAGLDWRFTDAPGGLGGNTSYGAQRHHAEFLAVRVALGAGVAIHENLSLGVSLGVTYNRNSLVAPYTFQSHPVLQGFKTLLDLQTEGWGVNGTVGLVWRPAPALSLGLSYRTPTHLDTDGTASGHAGVQLQNLGGAFAGVRPDFRYDAQVKTGLPQSVSGGLAWQMCPRSRFIVQVDWFNWSDSFDQLDIHLTRGNNADLNAFLGTDQIDDVAPLNWRDRFVYRAGVEFAATETLWLRAGYAYGANPVAEATFTPMSAAILEHTFTAGAEWRWRRYSLALAYQYDFSAARTVGASGLRSGEYSNSRTQLEAHWFGLTTGIRF